MLKIIRRVFDFGDWSRSHPRDPHPGDMLDAQFDEIIRQLDGWDERVRSGLRDDGVVAAGKVHASSLQPDLVRDLAGGIKGELKNDVETVKSALQASEKAKNLAQHALSKAQQAVVVVRESAETVRGSREKL